MLKYLSPATTDTQKPYKINKLQFSTLYLNIKTTLYTHSNIKYKNLNMNS